VALSVADLRRHVTSALEDPALQKLLDAAYEAIAAVDGASGNVTEHVRSGSGPLLMLGHTASAIVSVTEDATGAPIALTATDYALRPSGSLLERLHTGPNPASYWRGRVDVVYARQDRDAMRDSAAISLVKLDLNYSPGTISEQIGDWQETKANNSVMNYQVERETILATLGDPVGVY
jgi:hypothetical protein